MKFTECRDIEIVNCDFNKLKEQKKEIEKKNIRVVKHNRRIKTAEVFLIIFFSLFMIVLTSAAMIFLWQSVEFNMDGTFFSQFDVDPMWVKYVLEAVVLLLFISAFRIILASIRFNYNKNVKSKELVTEQIHFATVVENNIIGNLKCSKLLIGEPYVSQYIVFSFDAINKEETECFSFSSESRKWRAAHIPGLFKTIIDVGNLYVFLPYYDENATVKSIEDAYVYERRRRTELEEALRIANETSGDKEKETNNRLILAENQSKLFEKELARTTELLEQEKAAKADLQELYYRDCTKAQNQNEEDQKQIQKVLADNNECIKERDEAIAARQALEEDYNKLRAEYDVQTEDLRRVTGESEAKSNTIEQLAQEHKEKLQEVYDSCNEKIQTAVAESERKLQEATDKHSTEVQEITDKYNTDIQSMTEEGERKLHDVEESHLAEIQTLTTNYENTIREMQARHETELKETKESCEQRIRESETSYEEIINNKDLAYQQMSQSYEEEISEKQVEFEERFQEAAEEYATAIETQRIASEAEITELREQLDAEKRLVSDLSEERERNVNLIAQLEHNAKSGQIYHGNLEAEITELKGTIHSLQSQVEGYKNKEVAWNSSNDTIEAQKEIIANLEERCAMLQKQKETIDSRLRTSEDVARSNETECAQLREKATRLDDTLKKNASLEQSNGDLRERNKKITEEKSLLEEQIKEKDSSIERLSIECEEAKGARERVTADLLSSQQKLTTAQSYIASLEYDLKKAREEAEAAKAARVKADGEEEKKREAEGAEFMQLMKKREEQIRKAREDALAAHPEGQKPDEEQ